MKMIKKFCKHRSDRSFNDNEIIPKGEARYQNGKIIPDQQPIAIPIKYQRAGASTEEKLMKRLQNRISIQRAMLDQSFDGDISLIELGQQLDKAFDSIKDKFAQGMISPHEVTALLSEIRAEDIEFAEMQKKAVDDHKIEKSDSSDSAETPEE